MNSNTLKCEKYCLYIETEPSLLVSSNSDMCSFYFCHYSTILYILLYIDGLVHEKHNSSALAMVLRLSCINPSIRHMAGTVCDAEADYHLM